MALSYVNFLDETITRLPNHSTFTDKMGILYIRNVNNLTIYPAPIPLPEDEDPKPQVWYRFYNSEEEAIHALSTFLTTRELPEDNAIPAPPPAHL